MGRQTRIWSMISAALALLLVAGWHITTRQPIASRQRSTDGITILRSTPAGDGVRAAPTALPAARAPSEPTQAAEADTGNPIPADAAIEADLPDPAYNPATLYRRIRTEPRDTGWAPRSEADIRTVLAAIPNIGHGDAVRVRCASSLCEVRGSVADGASIDATNVAMQALQGDAFRSQLAPHGLDPMTAAFGSAGGGTSFTLYVRRR